MSTVATPIFPATSGDRQTSAVADLRRRVAALERGNGGITLANGSLAGSVITPGTMDPSFFGPGSIPGSVIIPGSLTVDRLLAGSITANYIAAGTIVANLIAANTIIAENIAANTITANQIAANSITATTIAANTITASQIATGTITAGLMAAGSVTSTALVSGAVTSTKISVADLSSVSASMGTLTAGRISLAGTGGAILKLGQGLTYSGGTIDGLLAADGAGNVTVKLDIADGSLALKGAIQPGSTGLGNIAGQIDGGVSIISNTVTGDRLVTDSVTAREIASSSITSVEILANTITAGQIASGTITATQIAAGTITAGEIAAGTITGTQISGDAIDGKTITGANIYTSSTRPRVELAGAGLQSVDSAGNYRVKIDPTSEPQLLFQADASDSGNRQARIYCNVVGTQCNLEMRAPSAIKILNFQGSGHIRIEASEFTVVSDAKIKKNITAIDRPLDRLRQIRGVTFDAKDEKRRRGGVIASEVAAAMTEASGQTVVSGGQTLQTVDIGAVVGLLVACVNEIATELHLPKGR